MLELLHIYSAAEPSVAASPGDVASESCTLRGRSLDGMHFSPLLQVGIPGNGRTSGLHDQNMRCRPEVFAWLTSCCCASICASHVSLAL